MNGRLYSLQILTSKVDPCHERVIYISYLALSASFEYLCYALTTNVYGRHILMSKVEPRAERVNEAVTAGCIYSTEC